MNVLLCRKVREVLGRFFREGFSGDFRQIFWERKVAAGFGDRKVLDKVVGRFR